MSKLFDLLNCMVAKLKNCENKIKQSDWNQNDKTAPDFVKNRPFWAGDPEKTVLVEEIANEWTVAGPTSGLPLEPVDIVDGDTYIVAFDGVEYECIAYVPSIPKLPCIGNAVVGNVLDGESNGEPFFIITDGETFICVSEAGNHTVSVTHVNREIHKIDKKYLPKEAICDFPAYPYNYLDQHLFGGYGICSSEIRDAEEVEISASKWAEFFEIAQAVWLGYAYIPNYGITHAHEVDGYQSVGMVSNFIVSGCNPENDKAWVNVEHGESYIERHMESGVTTIRMEGFGRTILQE